MLNGDLPGVIRAEGHFWLASRPKRVAELSMAGTVSSVTPPRGWWAGVPHERWPTHPDALAGVASKCQESWGDRRQEPVFIGAGLDEAALRARLDAALVPAAEFTPQDWAGLPDPSRPGAWAGWPEARRMGNLVSPRARAVSGSPMDDHDLLPPVLRIRVAQAALPWSAASVRRIFMRAIAETCCRQAALSRLDRAEAATQARDAPLVWGAAHPAGLRPSGLSQSAGRAA